MCPSKLMCWKVNPQCNSVGRWLSHGESVLLMDYRSGLIVKGESLLLQKICYKSRLGHFGVGEFCGMISQIHYKFNRLPRLAWSANHQNKHCLSKKKNAESKQLICK
jgi:hypothetical protein